MSSSTPISVDEFRSLEVRPVTAPVGHVEQDVELVALPSATSAPPMLAEEDTLPVHQPYGHTLDHRNRTRSINTENDVDDDEYDDDDDAVVKPRYRRESFLSTTSANTPVPTGSRGGAPFRLIAMLKKNALQKWRAKVPLLCEIFVPVFFAFCLVVVWWQTSTVEKAPRHYMEPNKEPLGPLGVFSDIFCLSSDPEAVLRVTPFGWGPASLPVEGTMVDFGRPVSLLLNGIFKEAQLGRGDSKTFVGFKMCPANLNTTESCFASTPIPGIAYCGNNFTNATADAIAAQERRANGEEEESSNVTKLVEDPRPWPVPSFDVLWMMHRLAHSDAIPDLASEQKYIRALRNTGQLFFAPDSADTRGLVAYLKKTCASFDNWFGGVLPTVSEGTDRIRKGKGAPMWGVVEVKSLNAVDGSEVTIHMRRDNVPNTDSIVDRFSQGLGSYNSRVYICSGFLTIQNAVADYFTREVLGGDQRGVPAPDIPTMIAMPNAAYLESAFLTIVGKLAPLAIVFGYLYTVSQITKRLVEEKEGRMREAMMIMGLDTVSFFTSWVITYALITVTTALAISAMCVFTMMPKADPTLVFVFFGLFGMSNVTLGILLSTLFSKSRVAALVAPVIFFALAVPAFAIPEGTLPIVLQCFSLLSPTAFSLGGSLMFAYETTTGLTWGDLFNVADAIPIGQTLFLLAFDTVFYMILALYLDAVLPSEWGTRKHPLFFITDPIRAICGKNTEATKFHPHRGIWAMITGRAAEEQSWRLNAEGFPDSRNPRGVYEDRNNGLASMSTSSGLKTDSKMTNADDCASTAPAEKREPAVRIQGLRKEFGSAVAVDNLSVDLHEGEIAVMLGHNGAGKTTTINCMTGMLEPTSGDCTIYGHSTRRDMRAARAEIGICPQHNILWDGLTCREHLEFFAALKGVPAADREDAIEEMFDAVDLGDKADDFSCDLSGGQKRKLSVAIAFIGGSRMVFLDEPTAGMDVAARRFTWDLIKQMSPGRTIVLTTHFMDEADLLGNTISIMAKGRLQCSGSPLFLKSRLGVGYTLTLSLQQRADRDALVDHVGRFVPDASVLTNSAGELALRLPMASVPRFPDLLRVLETRGETLGVRSHGISVTTLEEIFLRISKTAEDEAIAEEEARDDDPQSPTATADVRDSGDDADADVHDDDDGPLTDRQTTDTNSDLATVCDGQTRQLIEVQGVSPSPTSNSAELPSPSATVTTQPRPAPISLNTERPPPVWASRGSHSYIRQFIATFVKRFHNAKRDRRTQVLQIVLPVVCIAVAMGLSRINLFSAPYMEMTPSQYQGSQISSLMVSCPEEFAENVQQVNHVKQYDDFNTYDTSRLLLGQFFEHRHDRLTSATCVTRDTVPALRLAAGVLDQYDVANTRMAASLFTNETRYRHSAPLSLNGYHNAIARSVYAARGVTLPSPAVRIASHPLPLSEDDTLLQTGIRTFFIAIFVMIPFTFVPSTFVAWVVKERECKARHIQDVSGMNYVVYWLANLTFDSLSFVMTTGLAIGVFYGFDRDEYVGDMSRLTGLATLFGLYGFAGVTGSYVLSFAFTSHSTAQNVTMMGNFICGFLLVLAAYVMTLLEDTKSAGQNITWGFRTVPTFALGNGIIQMALQHAFTLHEPEEYLSPWHKDVNYYNFLFLAAEGPIFFIITLILDHPSLRGSCIGTIGGLCSRATPAFLRRDQGPQDEDQDDDVVAERLRVERMANNENSGRIQNSPLSTPVREQCNNTRHGDDEGVDDDTSNPFDAAAVAQSDENEDEDQQEDDLVIVRGLRKEYNSGAKVAVKDLTFGVHRGEVFGFLGTNGAGKTTTMSILCGEQLPTSGQGSIAGHDVVRDAASARSALGYCPQFDALLELLTVDEHLYLYGRLRGLGFSKLDEVVNALIECCGLQPHRSKQARSLSGGNKRKLSVAIALVGGPQVLFLDEPSAGMDPGARHTLWDVIDAVAQHCSIVLTTHHLEEVEALATRVAIMDKGEMKCIGSLQHLKSKFGSGFEVSMRVRDEHHVGPAMRFVEEMIPEAELQEERGRKLTFALPRSTKLSYVFEVVEHNKGRLRITDYGIAQTSLESVFLKVAEHEEEAVNQPVDE